MTQTSKNKNLSFCVSNVFANDNSDAKKLPNRVSYLFF